VFMLFVVFTIILNIVIGFQVAGVLATRYRKLHPELYGGIDDFNVSVADSWDDDWGLAETLSESTAATDPNERQADDSIDDPTDDSAGSRTGDEGSDADEGPGLDSITPDDIAAVLGSYTETKDTPDPGQTEHAGGPTPDEDAIHEQVAAAVNGDALAEVLGNLRVDFATFNDTLAEADATLRGGPEASDAATIDDCLKTLREQTETFLSDRDEHFEQLSDLVKQSPDAEQIDRKLREVAKVQDERIASASELLSSFAPKNPEGCHTVLTETNKISKVNHQARDAIDAAVRALAAVLPGDQDDLANLDYYAAVGNWWAKDPHHMRPMCVAVFDMDLLQHINEKWGQRVGDSLSERIEATIRDRSEGLSVTRTAGQQFTLVLTDKDLHQATEHVEEIRQTIEATTFLSAGEAVRAGVSVGLTRALREDTDEKMLTRAIDTVREAKRYGRNRTFLNEGKYPAPITPPNLVIEETTVTL